VIEVLESAIEVARVQESVTGPPVVAAVWGQVAIVSATAVSRAALRVAVDSAVVLEDSMEPARVPAAVEALPVWEPHEAVAALAAVVVDEAAVVEGGNES
jgi:hypothetical protein